MTLTRPQPPLTEDELARLETAARTLAEARSKNKHGQLCPVWARRNVSRGRAPTVEQCDCWVLLEARADARVVIDALRDQRLMALPA